AAPDLVDLVEEDVQESRGDENMEHELLHELIPDSASEIFEREDREFAEEEAIKRELFAEIQMIRESQDEDDREEEEWQVDEEEFVEEATAAVEELAQEMQASQAHPRAESSVSVRKLLPKTKRKPTPPSEPPSWYRQEGFAEEETTSDAVQGSRRGNRRMVGSQGKEARKQKRKAEYWQSPPPSASGRKSSNKRQVMMKGDDPGDGDLDWRGSDWWEGREEWSDDGRHRRVDATREWSWKEGAWSRSSSSNRGWSWKRS
ncbi:unnamed protein product, partial [Symbiodinium pilosum]